MKKGQHINLNEMDLIKYIKNKIIEKKAILEEIAKGTMLFNPVLSLEEIKQFELKHCINLPSDYKLFISEIGNGGVGPGLGLKTLYESTIDFKLKSKPCICLNQEFPYQKKWNESWIASFDWDEDYPDSTIVDHYMDINHIAGCLQISHKGHGCTSLLVIKGVEFGKIWMDNRADYGGIKPFTTSDDKHLTFGEWYADWITNLV